MFISPVSFMPIIETIYIVYSTIYPNATMLSPLSNIPSLILFSSETRANHCGIMAVSTSLLVEGNTRRCSLTTCNKNCSWSSSCVSVLLNV